MCLWCLFCTLHGSGGGGGVSRWVRGLRSLSLVSPVYFPLASCVYMCIMRLKHFLEYVRVHCMPKSLLCECLHANIIATVVRGGGALECACGVCVLWIFSLLMPEICEAVIWFHYFSPFSLYPFITGKKSYEISIYSIKGHINVVPSGIPTGN